MDADPTAISEAGAALRAVVRAGDEHERVAALEALAYVADPAVGDLVGGIVSNARQPLAVRAAGVRALAAVASEGHEEALELLSWLLLDDEEVIVNTAADALASVQDTRVPMLVAARLRDPAAEGRRAAACRAMGEFWRRFELDLAGALTRRDRRDEAYDAVIALADARRS